MPIIGLGPGIGVGIWLEFEWPTALGTAGDGAGIIGGGEVGPGRVRTLGGTGISRGNGWLIGAGRGGPLRTGAMPAGGATAALGTGIASVGRAGRPGGSAISTGAGGEVGDSDGASFSPALSSTPTMKSPM